MKKILNSLFALIIVSIGFTSCEDISDRVILNENVEATTELIVVETTPIVLLEANQDDIALNTNWAEPDYGFNAAPTYKILVDLASGDFSNATTIDVGDDLEKSFGTLELNSIALGLGAEADMASDLSIKLQGFVGGQLLINSDAKTINVTPYSSILDLSTTWGVVGSAANDWGATPDLPFFTTSDSGVLVAYVTLIDGEIKFRENNDWTNNYGDTGVDGTLDAAGDNIAVTAGSYKILFNLNDLTYTMEEFTIGIVGSAYNDWGATPDYALTYDPYSDQFRGIVKLEEGEMKFRINNDWGTAYGAGSAGFLDTSGGNIATIGGRYIVTVNLNDLSYSLEAIDNIWGLVGSAYNDWGATSDAIFTRDWSQPNDDIWILNNVTLLDGEYKFRANEAWALNYGDTGSDGTLDNGGDNIISVAGTYSFVLDFTDPDNPIYTIN
ncbi:SusE domain-containing protein [Polaribacter vadi]|uniref:SusE domain-containing protein n=1 Tax=Polaribacter TaxID=52959 RepID=UPI001C09934D|nr:MULTISPECIES: SusE domain-containing protein [Polaribacter]MBU3012227.1 SusE domain-containing protein [Polaribacter vadi]MDO6742043.1 SusE domain-containing protein [Polaribacter sp. 1_MG-2023]